MKLICFAFVLFISVTYGQITTQNKKGVGQHTIYHTKNLIYFPNPDYSYTVFNDSLCLVRHNKKYGIIDSTGKEVVPLIYDEIDIDFSTRKIINYQLKAINEFFYAYWEDGNESEELYSQLREIELKNPMSYLNLSTEFKSNPLFAAKKESQWGVINKSNAIVIPFQYDYVKDIGQDIFLVKSKGKSGIINSKNELIVPIICDTIEPYPAISFSIYKQLKNQELTGPGSFALLKQENKFGIINLFTQKVILPTYDSLEICFPVPEYDCMCGFSTKEIWTLNTFHPSPLVHSFYNVVKFKVGAKFGLLNVVTMQEITPPIYDSINFVNENIVQLNGKSSLLINQNTRLNQNTYDEIRPIRVQERFSIYNVPEPKAFTAKRNGQFGILNESGIPATKIEWDSISTVIQLKDTTTCEFIVKRKQKFGVINNHNQVVVPIKYDSISLEYELTHFGYNYHYLLRRRGKSEKIFIE